MSAKSRAAARAAAPEKTRRIRPGTRCRMKPEVAAKRKPETAQGVYQMAVWRGETPMTSSMLKRRLVRILCEWVVRAWMGTY